MRQCRNCGAPEGKHSTTCNYDGFACQLEEIVKPANVTCPKCDGPMVSRVNSQSGQRFWGCKAYPNCRGTRDTDGNAPSERERGPRLPFDKDAEPDDLPSQRPARLGPRWRQ